MPYYAPCPQVPRLPLPALSPTTDFSSNASSAVSSPTTDRIGLDSKPDSGLHTPVQHNLEILADRESVGNVCKAILHTIFFHRYFGPVNPQTHHLLEITLPATDNNDIHALIDQKVADFICDIDTERLIGGRGQISLMFFEKRRRETYFFSSGDHDVCWEKWNINVTIGTPRCQSERLKLLEAMKCALRKAADRIISLVIRDGAYLPSSASIVSPYSIDVNPQLQETTSGLTGLWGFPTRLGFGRRLGADVFAA